VPTPIEKPEIAPEPTPAPAPSKSPRELHIEKLKADYDIVEPSETPPVPAATPQVSTSPAAVTPSAGTGATQLPAYLIRQAKELDFSDDEIADHTEKSLERAVSREFRRTKELATRTHVQTPAASNIGTDRVENDGPPKVDWGTVKDEVTGEERAATDDDVYGPVASVVKRLNEELHALKSQVKVLTERETVRERRQQASWLDQRFAARSDVFGSQTVDEIDRTSPEFLRRQSVLSTVEFLGKQDRELGRKRTMEELFDAAVSANFGGSARPAPADKIAPKVGRDPSTGKFTSAPPPVTDDEAEELEARKKAFAEGGIEKPTDRQPPRPAKGPDLARQTVARFLRAQDERNGDGHDEDDESI
jgi:hypothetical protein